MNHAMTKMVGAGNTNAQLLKVLLMFEESAKSHDDRTMVKCSFASLIWSSYSIIQHTIRRVTVLKYNNLYIRYWLKNSKRGEKDNYFGFSCSFKKGDLYRYD